MISPSNTEALVITSAAKTVPEIQSGLIAVSRVANDPTFFEDTLINITKHTNIKDFVVVHDLKVDSLYSINHQKMLLDLRKRFGFKLFVSPTSLSMPSQLTASMAFKLGLANIEKNYFLFWEHDHIFTAPVNWDLLDSFFKESAKMVRFNRDKNPSSKNNSIDLDFIYKTGKLECIDESYNENLLWTSHYSNGPFLSEKSFCNKLWSNVNYSFPDWNGHFGGFIEGPVNQFMLEDQMNLSNKDFKKKYPIFIYGGYGYKPIVKHRGTYQPKYQLNKISLSNISIIPKYIKSKIISLIKREQGS